MADRGSREALRCRLVSRCRLMVSNQQLHLRAQDAGSHVLTLVHAIARRGTPRGADQIDVSRPSEPALDDRESALEFSLDRNPVPVRVPMAYGRHHRPDQGGGNHSRFQLVDRLI